MVARWMAWSRDSKAMLVRGADGSLSTRKQVYRVLKRDNHNCAGVEVTSDSSAPGLPDLVLK